MTTREASVPLRIAVLGSTGSIGVQTLDVVANDPDRFQIVGLAAKRMSDALRAQIARFRPSIVAIGDDAAAIEPGGPYTLVRGVDGLVETATHPDVDLVVFATAGHAAILPTIRAIEAGKAIALANKETIVCAGELIIPLAKHFGTTIRPVDSEHSAIWQSLGGRPSSEIARLIITASGGPFRGYSREQLANVTAKQALAHPTWSMGGKITVDSATLMNKGLEIIEAKWLFDVGFDRIETVIHPESIVHSLVEFIDGSVIAQLGWPDMRLPIQYALTYPNHVPGGCKPLSLVKAGSLHFFEPDHECFPAVQLARAAGEAGGTAPTVLSAADEVAVEAFLQESISFEDIVRIVSTCLEAHDPVAVDSVSTIAEVDRWARSKAAELIGSLRS